MESSNLSFVIRIDFIPKVFIGFLKLMSHFQSLAGEFHQMNDSTDCEYHKLASEDSVIALHLPLNFTPSYKSHTQLMVNESK